MESEKIPCRDGHRIFIADGSCVNQKPSLTINLISNSISVAVEHDGVEALAKFCDTWLKENPPKVTGWLNIYEDGSAYFYSNESLAKPPSIGCVSSKPHSYTFGEGLEKGSDT